MYCNIKSFCYVLKKKKITADVFSFKKKSKDTFCLTDNVHLYNNKYNLIVS